MQFRRWKRRDFITLLGSAAAWPLTARAQQRDRVKRLGVLWGLAENDNVYEPHLSTFKQRLQDLGWIDGRNIRVEYRFTGGVTDRIHIAAQELAALAPDVIFAIRQRTGAALPRQAHRGESRPLPMSDFCSLRRGLQQHAAKAWWSHGMARFRSL
jgi:hypothetical protein